MDFNTIQSKVSGGVVVVVCMCVIYIYIYSPPLQPLPLLQPLPPLQLSFIKSQLQV